jgi:hypothetical protein
MKMKLEIMFNSEDWRKLTEEQRTTLIKLRKDRRKARYIRYLKQDETPKDEDKDEPSNKESNNDLRSVLSSKTSRTPRTVNICKIKYRVTPAFTQPLKVMNGTMDKVDITGIANNSLKDVQLATVAGMTQTDKGYIIGVFHQYAHQGEGNTIHSVNQLKHFGCEIDKNPSSL